MSEAKKLGTILPGARLSYCHVFKKGTYEGKEAAKFECTMLFPKEGGDDLKEKLRKMAIDALMEKYGSKDKIPASMKNMVSSEMFGRVSGTFLSDGDTKDDDNYKGMWVVKAANAMKPATYTRDKRECTEDDGLIYSGAFADVKVSPWVMDNAFGKKIPANLEGLRFREHGTPLAGGGSKATADDFDDVDDDVGGELDDL